MMIDSGDSLAETVKLSASNCLNSTESESAD